MNTKRLTSVKVEETLFEKFKDQCLEDNFTFQKLADRAIFLYLTDPDFKQRLLNQLNIELPR
jgi:hypothetical protein